MTNPAFPQGEGGQLKWVELDSNSIASVAFERDTSVLYVEFNSGSKWRYEGVPYKKYKGIIYAGSSGNYLRKEIIAHHAGTRIEPDEHGNDRSEGSNNPGAISGSSTGT